MVTIRAGFATIQMCNCRHRHRHKYKLKTGLLRQIIVTGVHAQRNLQHRQFQKRSLGTTFVRLKNSTMQVAGSKSSLTGKINRAPRKLRLAHLLLLSRLMYLGQPEEAISRRKTES
uniref:Uncharacterized protein n=1 Tax=Triticum urartu TaxID=4572 RepID=A0A8R7TK55_TRIUA